MKLREKYIFPNLDNPSKMNELPQKYSAIVNTEEWDAFVKYTATDAYKVLISHLFLSLCHFIILSLHQYLI